MNEIYKNDFYTYNFVYLIIESITKKNLKIFKKDLELLDHRDAQPAWSIKMF